MTEIYVTDVELVRPGSGYGQRSRAERHAMAFIARYPVERTREAYETGLRQFFGWCDEARIDPLDATWKEIELFARTLELAGRKPATVAARLNVLAGFYKYALIDGLIEKNPMVFVSRPKLQRISSTVGLTRTEFADVLNVADQIPLRDHALICVLGLNGLRVAEATGIDIEDLGRWRGQRTVCVLRKGGKRQVIPFASRTAWLVDQLAADRDAGPLFLSASGRRLDRAGAARIVTRTVRKAHITKRITPHSFRHTFVTMALDAGQRERDIAASTGHADSRMVSYYDRNRDSIARNSTHAVAAWVEGAT